MAIREVIDATPEKVRDRESSENSGSPALQTPLLIASGLQKEKLKGERRGTKRKAWVS